MGVWMTENLLVSTDAPVELISAGGPELPKSIGELMDYAYSAGHAHIAFELRLNLVRTILDFFGGKNRRVWEHKSPAENAINQILDELYGTDRPGLCYEKAPQGRRFKVSGKSRSYLVDCHCTPAIPAGAAVILRIVSATELGDQKLAI